MSIIRLINILIACLMLSISISSSAALNVNIQSAFDSKNYDRALSLTEKALKKDKKNKELLLAKGVALVKLQQLDKAIKHYKSLKRKLTTEAEPGNNLAIIYRVQGNNALAIKEFKATIKKFPRYAPAYAELGDTYMMMAKAEYQRGFSTTGSVPLKNKLNALTSQSGAPKQGAQQASNADVAPSQEVIINTLKSWTDAWASQNINRYLSHYSNNFKPENGVSIKTWIETKKVNLQRPNKIMITLSDVAMNLHKNKTVTAKFTQRFQTKTTNLTTGKILTLQKSNNNWLIIREVVLKK